MKTYYRVTCYVPDGKFACDCPQLRDAVSRLPEGVALDEDGISRPESAVVRGGELAVWYEASK